MTNWKSLCHAVGPATKLPGQIEKINDPDAYIRSSTYQELRQLLVENNQWFSAAAPAAGLMLDLLSRCPDPGQCLLLLADMVGGDQYRIWQQGAGESGDTHQGAIGQLLNERCSDLLSLSSSPDAHIRGALAVLISVASPWLPMAASELTKLSQADVSSGVRSDALLGLACMGKPIVEKVLSGAQQGTPLLRGVAELVRLKQDPSRPIFADPQALNDLICSASDSGNSDAQISWLGLSANQFFKPLPGCDRVLRLLIDVIQSRNMPIQMFAKELVEFATARPGLLELHAGKILLVLGGFSPKTYKIFDDNVIPISSLSEQEKVVIDAMATTDLIPLAMCGMPASGQRRLAWAGLGDKGVLERPVGEDARQLWDGLPRYWGRDFEKVLETVNLLSDPVEQWEVLTYFAAWTYWTTKNFPAQEVEVITQRAAAQVNFTMTLERVAADLNQRLRAQLRQGLHVHCHSSMAALLLLPLVRNGRAIPQEWDIFVSVQPNDFNREILVTLSVERREAIVQRYVERCDEQVRGDKVLDALGFIELFPTRSVAQVLLHAVNPARYPEDPSWEEWHVDIFNQLKETTLKFPDLGVL